MLSGPLCDGLMALENVCCAPRRRLVDRQPDVPPRSNCCILWADLIDACAEFACGGGTDTGGVPVTGC